MKTNELNIEHKIRITGLISLFHLHLRSVWKKTKNTCIEHAHTRKLKYTGKLTNIETAATFCLLLFFGLFHFFFAPSWTILKQIGKSKIGKWIYFPLDIDNVKNCPFKLKCFQQLMHFIKKKTAWNLDKKNNNKIRCRLLLWYMRVCSRSRMCVCVCIA